LERCYELETRRKDANLKPSEEPILLFDGVCHFCNHSVQFVIRHDKLEKFKFAALQSSAGQNLLQKHSLPTDDFDSFILIKNDKLYKKSTASLRLCLELGGLWRIFYLFVIIPLPLRDGIYNTIARNRYKWFGKRDKCMIPSSNIRKRFLS
jgi:predicted DCC family thiol-disulfide oxidoreductase YuxK